MGLLNRSIQAVHEESGHGQAHLRGQRAAQAELEHRLVVPENMTLTRPPRAVTAPARSASLARYFALCDYVMLFDLF